MEYEIFTFDNFGSPERSRKKYSEQNESLFRKHFPDLLRNWCAYLEVYSGKTSLIFGKAEFPWEKFDEPTWVSSLAIAVAKNYPEAILVEELPVKKKSGATDYGNADLWCCLNPAEKDEDFSFYLEAKFSPSARKKIVEKETAITPIRLEDVQNQIANSDNKNSLLSRMFRDYQKSAGKQGELRYFTTKSPHTTETDRKHAHVFLTMLIKPVVWDKDEKWEGKVMFANMFEKKKMAVYFDRGNAEESPFIKNIYNFPCTGVVVREKTKGHGFVALVMMLGESTR